MQTMGKSAYTMLTGLGVWMLDLCLQLFSSAYPEKLKPHPYVIVAIGLFGLIVICVGGYQWFVHRSTSPPVPTSEKRQTARDVNGQMFQAETLIYNEALKQETPKPHPIAPTQPTLAEPRFEIHPRVAHIVYELSPGCWKECPEDHKEAKRALIVDVMRDVPPPGQKSKHSVTVLAILKFTNIGTERIPRAYWLSLQDYRAGFIVGHKESLIIGTYEEPYLVSYTNPQFGELMEDQFPTVPLRERGPRTIMPAIPFTVEISLWDWHANSTIQQNTMAVEFQETRFLVPWFL